MEDQPWRILLVEDDHEDYLITRALLSESVDQRYSLKWVSSIDEARQVLDSEQYHAVLVDYNLGARSGVELVQEASESGYSAPMILLTGDGSYSVDLEAMHAGAADYLTKGEVTPRTLERSIRYAVERKQTEASLRERSDALEKARANLEAQVEVHTRDLKQANRRLKQVNKKLQTSNQLLNQANKSLKAEIAERQRVEARLREREARLNLMLEQIPAVLWSTDEELKFTSSSGKGLEPLGLASDQVTGQSLEEFARILENGAATIEAHRRALQGEVASYRERAAGRTFECHVAPLREASGGSVEAGDSPAAGRVIGTIGVALDSTQWAQAEALVLERSQQLQASTALFEGLFESAPDATLLVNREGVLLRANRQVAETFGFAFEELAGRPVEILLSPGPTRLHFQERLANFPASLIRPEGVELELYGMRKDGSQFPVDMTLSPLQLGGETQLICVLRDISRRKQAEDALRSSETRFRTVFEESALGIALKSLDGRLLTTNPALQEMLGYSAGELVYRNFEELTDPADLQAEKDLFVRLAAGEIDRYRLEKRYIRKDGSRMWARVAVSLIRDEAGQPQFALFLIENTTERKDMEAELAEVRWRLIDNRENERLELARDLHDGPIQELYSMVYLISELQGERGLNTAVGSGGAGETGRDRETGIQGQEEVDERLREVQAQLVKTIQNLRAFCGELRPPTLTPFGLEATLRSHAEAFQEMYPEIELSLELQPDEQELPEPLRLALFRIYQHSLANVARHSRARRAWVNFSFDSKQVRLRIQDDGQGFEVPARWVDFARQGHLGLVGAFERVEAIGGTLRVQSAPGQGTLLEVTAPR